QIRLDVVPVATAVLVAAAHLVAVAVGRLVVVVGVAAGGVVAAPVVAVGAVVVVHVGGRVVRGMAHGGLEFLPGRGAALAVAGVPVAAQVGLDVVPVAALVLAARFRAVAVGRRVVVVAAAAAGVVALPVAAEGAVVVQHAARGAHR